MVSPRVKHTHAIEAVVLGASAGAIDALGVLLPQLPASAQLPFIVVVHVPAHKPSLLPEIFAPRCALPVAQPFDKQPIERGIWLAPSNYHLLVESDRTFAMSIDEPVHYSRPSIDVLFETAAEAYGPALAAVVLTGASRDGARGASRVRASGGLVLVQDPSDADVDIMPLAAIEESSPQLIAPLAELASALSFISRGSP